MGFQLLPGHQKRLNLLRSVLWKNSSSMSLLTIFVYIYVSMCMYGCNWIYLHKHQNVRKEAGETEPNISCTGSKSRGCQAWLSPLPESRLWALLNLWFRTENLMLKTLFSSQKLRARQEASCWSQEWSCPFGSAAGFLPRPECPGELQQSGH